MAKISNLTELGEALNKKRLASRGKPFWICIDSECKLFVRGTTNPQGDAFYFRLSYPRCISRSIGSIDTIPITKAKRIAFELLEFAEKGMPLPHCDSPALALENHRLTLAEVMMLWQKAMMEMDPPRWSAKDKKAITKFSGLVKNYVQVEFQRRAFHKISASEIAEFLGNLYRTHASFAQSLTAWIRATLSWAQDKHFCDNGRRTVAELNLILASDHRRCRRGLPRHHSSLPYDDLPAFMAELRHIPGVAARCLEVSILTCSRVGNAVSMRWADIDMTAGIWKCPPNSMKCPENGSHIVYLSRQAIALINDQPRRINGKDVEFVFLGAAGKPLCSSLTKPILAVNTRRAAQGLPPFLDPEMTRLKNRNCPPTVHGFRATFKSWSVSDSLGNYGKFPERAVEACMHHYRLDAYKGAYYRERHDQAQREILQIWADYCYSATLISP